MILGFLNDTFSNVIISNGMMILNDEFGINKEVVEAYFKAESQVFLEGLRKTTKMIGWPISGLRFGLRTSQQLETTTGPG
jgi:hypothetical protein